jgi:small subunit ribosomal protein S18
MEEQVVETQNTEKSINKYKKRRFSYKKKYCYFCAHRDVKIDYKDVDLLKRFVSESFKITPRRFTGTCAKHQRKLANEIKKARIMALLPFIEE